MSDSLSAQVHNALISRGLTIATAESITAGLVASSLAGNSGSSKYLVGGVVAYTLDMKVQVLYVDRDIAAACDCVSADVAMQMANGVVDLLGANIGVATTGYAETSNPDGPYAWVAVSFRGNISVRRMGGFGLSRNEMRQRVTEYAMTLVLIVLEAE